MFVRNKFTFKTFLPSNCRFLEKLSIIHNIYFSSEKSFSILFESGEKYAQIKHKFEAEPF